ncbi:MAG TPA: Mur ligase family protein [Spirochaetota bacterium]|nr:Mur ligase family protein [Spirochaetota bacterium]
MNLSNIKKVHIIGIGGCASSAIAELLINNGINVSGSEMKYKKGLEYLEKMGIKIDYRHSKDNLTSIDGYPDVVLYSPAVLALDPDNEEVNESRVNNIPLISWQKFVGDYLNQKGKTGITVSGSEGKGTTAGILTTILKGTDFDPLSILGAKVKNICKENSDSNIYIGKGETYILEGDEYNRNFYSYRPGINITVNFAYEHPETYKDFNQYQEAFYHFFKEMNSPKTLVLRATNNLINFIDKFQISNTHKILWYGKKEEIEFVDSGIDVYLIEKTTISQNGISFELVVGNKRFPFKVNSLPEYLIYNATGAIIAAFELGLPYETIRDNLLNFRGMVRRFDVSRTKNDGIFITDYGHSPESLNHIIDEIKNIYKDRKLHTIFQPHLFSRTLNFFTGFTEALKKSDRVSLIDIYPAREKESEWKDKISVENLYDALKKSGSNVFYAGKSCEIEKTLTDKIDESEVTLFIGAGDMDLYYPKIFEKFFI